MKTYKELEGTDTSVWGIGRTSALEKKKMGTVKAGGRVLTNLSEGVFSMEEALAGLKINADRLKISTTEYLDLVKDSLPNNIQQIEELITLIQEEIIKQETDITHVENI